MSSQTTSTGWPTLRSSGEASTTLLVNRVPISAVEFHHSHDVGQYLGRGRMELLMHDRPGEEAAPPIDFLPRRIERMTERTDRSRGVAIGVARRAAVHDQPVLSGRLEERQCQGVDRRPGHGVGEPARAMACPARWHWWGYPGSW